MQRSKGSIQNWIYVLHILSGVLIVPSVYLAVSSGATTRVPGTSAAIICVPSALMIFGILRIFTFPLFPRLALVVAIVIFLAAVKVLWFCVTTAGI
jgi:hypothetical protein